MNNKNEELLQKFLISNEPENSYYEDELELDDYEDVEEFLLIKNEGITPKKIYDSLSKVVIGQDEAKWAMAIAGFEHIKRIQLNQKGYFDKKSNTMIVGPSGCGKTLLAEALGEALSVPVVICNASEYTSFGYVGNDPTDCLVRLLQECKWNKNLAERGIVVLDEIDKIRACNNDCLNITRDVAGADVQNAILRMIEGSCIDVPYHTGRRNPVEETMRIDTSNILFIGVGAFSHGLKEIISRRVNCSSENLINKSNSYYTDEMLFSKVDSQCIEEYGFSSEFVGRFARIASVNPLSEDELRRILAEPYGAIVPQYIDLFRSMNVELSFTDDALNTIAKLAANEKYGARYLTNLVEKSLEPALKSFTNSKKKRKLVITEKNITGEEKVAITVA